MTRTEREKRVIRIVLHAYKLSNIDIEYSVETIFSLIKLRKELGFIMGLGCGIAVTLLINKI